MNQELPQKRTWIACDFESQGHPVSRRFDLRNQDAYANLHRLLMWAVNNNVRITIRPHIAACETQATN